MSLIMAKSPARTDACTKAIMRRSRHHRPLLVLGFLVLVFSSPTMAQLNQNCVVAVLNRTVQVNPDGTWILPNVPANFGPVRARATCVQNGITTFGQSNFFNIGTNQTVNLPHITLGSTTPIPVSLAISSSIVTLTSKGATAQLTVTASFAQGPQQEVTASSNGTQYNVSNPAIAIVNPDGLVTAVSSGTVVIQAVNEGTQGIINIQVVLAGASHGGIPDSWAIAHGLDPNDPAMPFEDPDHDGLTNLQEFQNGTDPHNPDTDGDGLTDGQEVLMYHTSPLLVSTDGTGIPDGVEVQTGTLGGTLAAKLAAAVKSLEVKPASFVLNVNTIQGLASQQLQVLGHLIDGKTTLDLTSTQEQTNYSSSDLTICNFGAPDGNIFAGNNGSCTITVTNNGCSAQATGIVKTFSPTALSFVPIPGFANGVDVNGNFAFVAAGGAGLQVVNVTDRTHPVIVGSIALPGNANDVKLLGNFAYVAAGSAGVHIIDVTNPLSPVRLGTLGTGASALDIAVRGTNLYVANSSNLLLADVTNPASPSVISTLTLAGSVRGLDVDVQRNLVVVTAGTNGIYVVDISNPKAPALLGTVSTGDARDVAIRGNFAFVADFQNSTTSVDITSPSAPVVLSHITDPNLGGFLQDIVLSGQFALAADVKFVNGIPITDISDPTNLIARAILNFPQRDDNAMGIAADGTYVYLATEHSNLTKFGSFGDSRLYIGQYLALVDNKGIPPIATITSPLVGSAVIAGSKLAIAVDARDDVAVAAVNFLVNGQIVFTSTVPPYQFNLTVPTGVTSITVGATAVDLGGNVGTAQTVVVKVIPDPLTTAIGTVVDKSSLPVAGATVTCLGISGQSGADGTFSIPGLPTVQGPVQCNAILVSTQTLRGTSSASSPVPGGTTNIGQIVIGVGNILLLADVTATSVDALVSALTNAGNTVTVHTPEFTWDTTNPSLAGFNCVVHLDGATFSTPLPTQSQAALENFVSNGGGFIASQWDGFERTEAIQTGLPDLVLQLWDTPGSQNCGVCTVTYNVVPGQEGHPVLAGVPSSFTFFADGHDAGSAVPFSTNPSTVLMTVPAGGPAVLVRQFGNGRVVNFSWAADYITTRTLLDPNVQKLYTNAVNWACH